MLAEGTVFVAVAGAVDAVSTAGAAVRGRAASAWARSHSPVPEVLVVVGLGAASAFELLAVAVRGRRDPRSLAVDVALCVTSKD